MVYPLGNVEQLAEAMGYYWEHPEALEQQGAAAYEHAVSHFSAEANAERVYEEISKL